MSNKKDLAKERNGMTNKNIYGSEMKIVIYNKAIDIWVQFEKGKPVHTTWQQFSKGEVKYVFDKSVLNIGYIGDGEYKPSENGRNTPIYETWRKMLTRCYDPKYHIKRPTYKDCSVNDIWHNFQSFAKWYVNNVYNCEETLALDKDIILKGNKMYSPDTCVFVPQSINNIFTKTNSSRGYLPIGVTYHKTIGKYFAQCHNGKGIQYSLGYFNTPEEAFFAYKTYKENLIKQVAEEYKNKITQKLYNAMINYIVEITD